MILHLITIALDVRLGKGLADRGPQLKQNERKYEFLIALFQNARCAINMFS